MTATATEPLPMGAAHAGPLAHAVGVGLRVVHLPHIFTHWPAVDFFEIVSENFMVDGGLPRENLERICARYPVVQHGVSLSIASAEPLDFDYLRRLKALCDRTDTPWFSDHLCWSQSGGAHLHDLLPTPYTPQIASFIAEKARIVQDFIGRPLALENLSSYVSFADSTMTEWDFYRAVVEQAGVGMMLDLNNVYVSSVNHHFDPMDYLAAVPWERVMQIHLAGPSEQPDGSLLDTHDSPVRDPVWALYRHACRQRPGIPTLLEWDASIPPFPEVHAQALLAREHARGC